MLAIIQARMTSTRLPSKVLLPIAGKPMIQWVVDRLRQADKLTNIVVATSDESSDDPICDYCYWQNIPCYRGALHDVAGRFLSCAESLDAEAFLRISGDSPLIDPMLVDRAVALHNSTSCDLTTNVQVRSFPKGQSVEVIRTAALAAAYPYFVDASDFEHVTRYFYLHPEQFNIESFSSQDRMGSMQLSVDTIKDLQDVELILRREGDSVSWKSAARLKREMLI